MHRFLRHILFFLFLYSAPAHAVLDGPNPKDTLKAAISYNLARFFTQITEDDASTLRPLVFCVYADDPVAQELRTMNAARDNKQAFVLREVTALLSFYVGCDLSFIPDDIMAELSLYKLAASGNVTIGATEGFLEAGGAVELKQVGRKFAFSVNLQALKLAEKSLSSRVLKLALEVRPAS